MSMNDTSPTMLDNELDTFKIQNNKPDRLNLHSDHDAEVAAPVEVQSHFMCNLCPLCTWCRIVNDRREEVKKNRGTKAAPPESICIITKQLACSKTGLVCLPHTANPIDNNSAIMETF